MRLTKRDPSYRMLEVRKTREMLLVTNCSLVINAELARRCFPLSAAQFNSEDCERASRKDDDYKYCLVRTWMAEVGEMRPTGPPRLGQGGWINVYSSCYDRSPHEAVIVEQAVSGKTAALGVSHQRPSPSSTPRRMLDAVLSYADVRIVLCADHQTHKSAVIGDLHAVAMNLLLCC